MVFLTMTPFIVGAISRLDETGTQLRQHPGLSSEGDPSLENPAIAKPISHGQIVQLWRLLNKKDDARSYSLENLLWGTSVYIPPPPPQSEPSDEYKTLMKRLRHEEEERKYQRMISRPSQPNALPKNVIHSSTSVSVRAQKFALVNQTSDLADLGDDDVTHEEVHRQVVLVLNFVVTIFGCATTSWILARWWGTPARLFLTLGATVVVAIAEVAVYSAYIWHLGQAKKKEARIEEVKEVVESWVLSQEESQEATAATSQQPVSEARRRHVKGSKR